MASHNEMGQAGEELAIQWLRKNNFEVLHHNWRYSYHEIDIIAKKNELLHFIEVKTRKSDAGGYPEQSVTKTKFRHLQRAAEQYLHQHPQYKRIQFDILSIIMPAYKEPDIFYIEDVFL
jgi:putative endonuclease